MDTIRKMYNIPVGFSDHTTDLLSSKVAISKSANVIERHFTLNKKMEGLTIYYHQMKKKCLN